MSQPRMAPRLRFSSRVLLLQLAVVFAVVLITAGTFAVLTYQRLGEQAESRALAVARAVASSEDVRSETAALAAAPAASLTPAALADGPLQRNAESARQRTGALFVVVTDDAGLRLAHPNPALLGRMVSTDPSVALAGGEETSQEHGTLGGSARAKVPVFSPGSPSAVVGEVSVGFSSDDVVAGLGRSIVPVVLIAAASLALGALASAALGARLKRLTLGLEPEEIAGLAQDQEAVLRGVDEGVIGVTGDGLITVFNAEARRLLAPESDTGFGGRLLAGSGLPGFLVDAAGAEAEYGPTEHVLGDRVVIVSARPVTLGGGVAGTRPLGRVIMVRDRTEVQALTRQLDAVNALGTALRAQRHEFANRLHTVAGLLDINQPAEAREYVGAIMDNGPLQYPARDLGMLRDPYLEAFIGAKSIEAHERGVELRIGAQTLVRGRITDPQDVTAVLGNLMDNAIRAAVTGTSSERWVEIELLDEHTSAGGTLHLVVADSGDGLIRVRPASAEPAVADPASADTASGPGAMAAATPAPAAAPAGSAPGAGPGSAPGAGPEVRELIFAPGYSTTSVTPAGTGPAVTDPASTDTAAKDPISGHGVGLALIRHLARRRGGDVWVSDDGAPTTHGAVFCARLPGVVSLKSAFEEKP